MAHRPVLLQKTIQELDPQEGQTVIDGTVGFGRHALALGEKLGPEGFLLGLDQDPEALKQAEKTLTQSPTRFLLKQGNFRDLTKLTHEAGINSADIILFDLGMSSWQIEGSGRGFSFLRDEPLLMTMSDSGQDLTAKMIINHWSERELADLFYYLSDEPASRKIAKAIVEAREVEEITTSGQLASLIEKAKPRRGRKRIHPATLVFQALRMEVNKELTALTEGLEQAWSILAPKGKLGVISFHSLEARIIKKFFREKTQDQTGKLKTKKAVKPDHEEIKDNPRARSANLRVIIKN